MDEAVDLRDRMVSAMAGQLKPIDNLALPAFKEGTVTYLVVHPLWSLAPRPNSLLGSSAAGLQGEVRAVDTYNLSRRLAWCWQQRREFAAVIAAQAPPPPVGQSGRVTVIPEIQQFTLSNAPRGLPSHQTPTFRRISVQDPLSVSQFYLVRHDSEYVVGRIQRQETGGVVRFWVQAANPWDDLPSFYTDREEIVAVLSH
jgi:hypothetical protein